ncbi:TPA: hypothetical protein NPP51_003397 [Klebsiella quasipneumoniae subsp. quasipneumoniae]|nr:hypothetical protein [Klebsiella quasipneumoniae subsp. quasipneumoniae]
MSTRELILQYLESNESFTVEALAQCTGLKRDTLSSMARKMVRAGELESTARAGNWLVYSRQAYLLTREGNTIFSECRQSPYMQRVLFVHGRRITTDRPSS